MPTVYRFRVSFEDYDEIYRDIEIKSTQTFEELHYFIQSSIGFDATRPASFYMSTDLWIKGQQISLEETTDREGNKVTTMKNAKLSNYIADPHQKIIYISDPEALWNFHVELFRILPSADEKKSYPALVKSVGDAPKQYPVVPLPKAAVPEPDDLGSLLGLTSLLAATDVADEEEDETETETDNMMEETEEEGVEADEIEGMGEEGEEDEKDEDSEEMGMADDDAREDEF